VCCILIRMPKQERRRIDEQLLRERLGLDEDWIDRNEHGTVHLPSTLPRFIARVHSGREVEELNANLDRLVAAGCRREALYFCLQQLSPVAEETRAGREWASVPGKDGEDDKLQTRARKLGTSEDLEVVVNNAGKALKSIRRYRRELLIAADVKRPPLPSTMLTEVSDVDEALSLLLKSLAWVRELAKSYTAPFETTLLKSKGLLYLTLYVTMYAETKEPRSPQHRAASGTPVRPKPEGRAKRNVLPADNVLARIAEFCTGTHRAPSDLRGKLKRFQSDYPTLYVKMAAKMKALHRNATP
jgi:hypothetical protein